MQANVQLFGQLPEILQRHGFRRRGAAYCRRGLGVRVERLWCTFTRRAAGVGNAANDSGSRIRENSDSTANGPNSHEFGYDQNSVSSSQENRSRHCGAGPRRGPRGPGLWKTVRAAGDGKPRREFSLPLALVAPEGVELDNDGPESDPFLATIDWVEATARGKVPSTWRTPPREPLEAALPTERRTVRSGPFARQAELICDDGRLAVRIPIATKVPESLAPARRAWLDQVVDDAEQHCRMVRLVQVEVDGRVSSIHAEVDLTGCPRFILPDLLRCGLDAAAHVVSRFVWSIGFLADPAVRASAWDVVPARVD